MRGSPPPRARLLALAAVALLASPAAAAAVGPLPPRPGVEVVNPFVSPYVYAAANSTFEAYRGFGPQVPPSASPIDLGALAAPFDYTSLARVDGDYWATDENLNASDQGLEWQAFIFYVSPALDGASSIAFAWNGIGSFRLANPEKTYLMAYDFDLARWQVLAETGFTLRVGKSVTGEITTNVSSYVAGNQVVFLVASEQGPPADIGPVGRPGGPPPFTTLLETDSVEVRAFLPTQVPALDLPQLVLGTMADHVTFRGPTLIEEGDIVVRGGATFELDHARLVMNGTAASIRVESGGSLRVLNGSVVTDSAADTDDGGPGDRHYWIEVLAGGEVYLDNSTVENAGVPGGPWQQRGLYLEDAEGALCRSALKGPDTALVADRTANVTVEDFRINNSGGAAADLQLTNESTVDATGLAFSRLAITTDSTLLVRTAIAVVVADNTGKPIRGADLKMEQDNGTVYASAGYGGTDPQTGRVMDFDDNPLATVLRAVDRTYLGRTTATLHSTEIFARYFEWTDVRVVSTTNPHTETFVIDLSGPTFHDAAAQLGYDAAARNFSLEDSFGPAVTVVDFNLDGRLDLFVAGGATRGEAERASASANRLYRQEPSGAFADATDAAGLTSKGANAAAWGDYDNDGDPDVFLVYQGFGNDHSLLWPGQPDALYRNNGDGTFTNVTTSAGVGERGHGASAAWGDYDGDGWLDLYVGNIGWVLAWLVRNESSTLYHNNRDGTFTDVTAAMGVNGGVPGRSGANQTLIFLGGDNATERARDSADGSGFVQAVAWLDFDRDGDQDLFLAEDFGSSVLYRNDRTTFTVVTAQAGLARVGSARGVQVLDIDNDGWLDIVQANRWVDFVWRNNRDGTFTDIAAALGLDEELPGTTPVPLDMDLDGRVDLFVGGGRTSTYHAYAPSYLWHNRGGGRFADITAWAGVARGNIRTMGAAAADLDGDGDPDLVTANADTRSSLFINDAPPGAWLKVRLNGTASPRDGQGAQVRLLPPGASTGQVQQVGGVGARGSGQAAELLFGLNGGAPSESSPWRLDVLWSSGVRQSVNVTSRNQVIEVTERAATLITPIANISVSEDEPLVVGVSFASTDPTANETALVEWTFLVTDQVYLLANRTLTMTFTEPGRVGVTVEVTDRTGFQASTFFRIEVRDVTPPSFRPFGDRTAVAGETVVFLPTNISDNDPRFASNRTIVWSFTDGGETVELSQEPASYVFVQPGDYFVTVTATDAANNSASTAFTVHVTAAPSFGVREAGIVGLALAAAAVAAVAILRSRKAKQAAQAERVAEEEQRAAEPKAPPRKPKGPRKEMR